MLNSIIVRFERLGSGRIRGRIEDTGHKFMTTEDSFKCARRFFVELKEQKMLTSNASLYIALETDENSVAQNNAIEPGNYGIRYIVFSIDELYKRNRNEEVLFNKRIIKDSYEPDRKRFVKKLDECYLREDSDRKATQACRDLAVGFLLGFADSFDVKEIIEI